MLRQFLLIFTLAICAPCLHAEEKSNEGFYVPMDAEGRKLYQEARKCRNERRCLELAQRLYGMEMKKGNPGAACAALCIPMQYWHLQNNEKEFIKAVEQLRSMARTTESYTLFYYSYYEQVDFYIHSNRSLKAMHLINELMEELKNNPSDYGAYMINVSLGNIYFARRDEVHAKEYYEKAIERSKSLKNTSDLPLVYISMARITATQNVDDREHYLHLALQYSINPTDSAAALMGLAHLYSYKKDNKLFRNTYDLYSPMLKRENLSQIRYEKWYKSNEAYRLMLEGKTDSATIVRQSINNPYYRYEAHADYYSSHGNLTMANAYLDSLVRYLRSSQSSQNVSDVAEMSAIYDNEQLRYDTKMLRENFTRDILIIVVIGLVIVMVLLLAWFIKHYRDMKRMQQLSQDLREARDAALQASKMKDIFIQNMSHEIRTPLNAVTGFAQLMLLPDSCFQPGEKESFIEHIRSNANLLTMLIDDILNFSDVESGNYKMELNMYCVNEICRTAIGTVEARVNVDEVSLSFEPEVEDSFMINTDARRVQQVLINFLTNAIKHTVEGHIILKVSKTEIPGNITFSVEDTGEGVPVSQAENIFQRFEKLNVFVQGTGLGLNICRIIAEKLNGKCYLDTTYPDNRPDIDHGARFIFTLPL